MKMKTFGMVIFLILTAGTLCFGTGGEADKTGGAGDAVNQADKTAAPLAFAPQPVHEFDPVLDGDEVIYSFVVQNKGDAELQIERVNTG